MTASLDVLVGTIGRAHGLRGEVAVHVRTDEPERRFVPGCTLRLVGTGSRDRTTVARDLIVRSLRWHSGTLLLAIDGVDDRTGAEAIINPLDEYAIEQALRLLDDGSAASVTYLSMGPDQAAEALRRALAMGGDDAVLVTDPALAGADEWATAKVLAAALDKLAY